MKDDRIYLLHINDAIERVLRYTADGRENFLSDDKTQDAVIRNLEVIGEAVKNLSPTITDQYCDTPWKQIAGMRDVLIHHYFGVKLETVWEVIVVHLPQLKERTQKILDTISE